MGEAGRPEVVREALGQPLVLSEDDPEHERAANSVCASTDGLLDAVA